MKISIPVLFMLVVAAVLWIQYAINKSSRLTRERNNIFWDKENKANTTRKTDISNLNYITIPTKSLPMKDYQDPSIDECRDTINELSTKKILNLTGISNTELKLKYGVGNLNPLSQYDNNYTTLVRTLQKWADNLYKKGYIPETTQVLEFAISINTDIVKTYRLLSKIYMEQDTIYKIDNLIEQLTGINIMNKESLLRELKQLRNS